MKKYLKTIVLFLLVSMLIIPSVNALDLGITPQQNSHTQITDENCGGTTTRDFSISNNAGGGVLCWYYTNKDSTKIKLTNSCLGPGQTKNFPVTMKMPASGTDSVSVQLECFDFYSFFSGDKCVSSYSYSDAMANKYSCGASVGNTYCNSEISLRYFDLSCTPIQFSVTSSKSALTLYNGQTETITITVNNQGSNSLNCDQGLGAINALGSQSFQKSITAPASGSGSKSEVTEVSCTSPNGLSSRKSVTITVNYQSNPAKAAISDAKAAISNAQTQISEAQSKIKEASNLGADIGQAQSYLNNAESKFKQAQTTLVSAESVQDSDSTTALSQANTAKNYAIESQTSSAQAKSTATSIIEDWTRLKTVAQNKISDANSAIDTAKQRIQVGEGVIYNATILGLDTVQAKAQIATARTKVDSATAYYQEASSMFKAATNKESFEGAKSKAQSAMDLAKEAEQLATSAYSSLAATLAVAGESSKAILNANSEVSQMNEIMTKLDYIIISTEKYGVNLADTKNVATSSKTSVDSAEDLLSQAKNRQASGSFNEAVGLANKARDEAAKSRNRLDTISHTMSLSAQKALDDAFEKSKSKIAEAESEVSSAASTYGATATLIVSAQSSLADAKKSLEEAKSHIDKVKTASGLSDLVKELDAAFKSVDETNKKITDSINDAKSAKLGLVKKVAGVGAAAAGAAGGGFLYYRWRKKKKGKKSEEKEHAEKKIKHEKEEKEHKEKKSKKILSLFSKAKCPECGHKIKKNQKFCPQCGKKVGD